MNSFSSFTRAALMVAVLLLFWTTTRLVEIYDWDMGSERALVLLAVLFATPVLVRLASVNLRMPSPRHASMVLAVIVCIFFGWHLLIFYENFLNPSLIDIATTTLAAGKLMLTGKNPYSVPIDPAGGNYQGYKYLPMMAVVYLPLGEVWGQGGVVATNLLLDLAVLLLVFMLGQRIGTPTVGLYSALLYTVTPFVPLEIFVMGSTDLAAVVPLLAALLLVEKKRGLAGCCIGLSISVKLSPGVFLAICCLPNSGRLRYFAGVAIGMLPILAYLLISPMDLISNAILFALQRSVDSTSWMYGLPSEYRLVSSALLLVALFLAGAYAWFKDPTLVQRCGMIVVCLVTALLSGAVAHRNYQLWWLPFLAILVAVATFQGLWRFKNMKDEAVTRVCVDDSLLRTDATVT